RFIIPPGRLPEREALAAAYAALFSESEPFPLALTGWTGAAATIFLEHLALDLKPIVTLRNQYGRRVQAEVFEVRLPVALFDPLDIPALQTLLNRAHELLAEVGDLRPYYEMPLGPTAPGWEEGVSAATHVIALHNRSADSG